jgi:hypothetical protein
MRKFSNMPQLPDWSDLAVGVALFISPWALQFSDISVAAWNAWVCGLIIMIMAAYSLFVALKEWEHWNGIVIGGWLMAAPWALGFGSIASVTAVHIVLGAFLIASEGWEIRQYRHDHVGDDAKDHAHDHSHSFTT